MQFRALLKKMRDTATESLVRRLKNMHDVFGRYAKILRPNNAE
jgi:outer membrane lipopolysaccharide assembly protein LptE/RlpB